MFYWLERTCSTLCQFLLKSLLPAGFDCILGFPHIYCHLLPFRSATFLIPQQHFKECISSQPSQSQKDQRSYAQKSKYLMAEYSHQMTRYPHQCTGIWPLHCLQLAVMIQELPKKVPMPAAVFNRTPNKERRPNNPSSKLLMNITPTRNAASPSINSSRRDKENSMMGNSRVEGEACMNHQFKEAAYIAIGECGKYCQKCAISMASQGVKVKRMNSAEGSFSRERRQELDALERQVEETLRLLGTKKVQTTQCQIHCNQTFEEQIDITQQYFMELHRLVDYYREQTLKYIENEFNQSQRIQKQLQQILQESINESNSIKYRLNPKDPNTICHAEEDKFLAMAQLFRMRLDNYKNTVRSWKPDEIVIKPINLCGIDHISGIFNDLYHKEVVLYEQPDSELRHQAFNQDVIPEEETLTEEDLPS